MQPHKTKIDTSFDTITEDIEKESLSSTAYYEIYKKQQSSLKQAQSNQPYIPLYQRPINPEESDSFDDDYDEKYVTLHFNHIFIHNIIS